MLNYDQIRYSASNNGWTPNKSVNGWWTKGDEFFLVLFKSGHFIIRPQARPWPQIKFNGKGLKVRVTGIEGVDHMAPLKDYLIALKALTLAKSIVSYEKDQPQ